MRYENGRYPGGVWSVDDILKEINELETKENFIGMIITVGHGDTVGAHWVSITRSPKCWKHNEAGAFDG